MPTATTFLPFLLVFLPRTARDPLASAAAESSSDDELTAMPVVSAQSVEILRGCRAELSVTDPSNFNFLEDGVSPIFQFEREGYFCVDTESIEAFAAASAATPSCTGDTIVPPIRFNQTIGLRGARAPKSRC